MSVPVPSYVYTYIKIGFLKQLIMDEKAIGKLKAFKEIEDFIEYMEKNKDIPKVESIKRLYSMKTGSNLKFTQSKLFKSMLKLNGFLDYCDKRGCIWKLNI